MRDGEFEFVVKEVNCGIAKVGDQYFNKVAQGQFCGVTLSVKNIGTKPQTMFSSNQYAFDASSRKFSSSTEAGIYADDSKLLFEEINPGNELTGVVYFDVPKDAKLLRSSCTTRRFPAALRFACRRMAPEPPAQP